jgi:hypothetical protein
MKCLSRPSLEQFPILFFSGNVISPGHNTTGNCHDNLQVPSSDLWIERPPECCCWPAGPSVYDLPAGSLPATIYCKLHLIRALKQTASVQTCNIVLRIGPRLRSRMSFPIWYSLIVQTFYTVQEFVSMGWDSSVGIATCYGLDSPGIESRQWRAEGGGLGGSPPPPCRSEVLPKLRRLPCSVENSSVIT